MTTKRYDSRPPTTSNKGFYDGGRYHWACSYLPVFDRGMRKAGEVDIWIEVEGRGDPLLLIHGGPDMDHRYFHPGMAVFAKSRRLIYLDLRGRFMARTTQPVGIARDVQDIAGVLTTIGLETVDVLGHSYGGFIAGAFALQFPSRVRKLVTVGTSWGETRPEVQARLARNPGIAAAKTPLELRRAQQALHFFNPPLGDHKKYYDKVVEWTESPGALDFLRRYETASPNVPSGADLKALTCPCLFVAGEEDPFTSVAGLRDVARKMTPPAEVLSIPQCGHMPWVEKTEEFREGLEAFLSK